MPLPNQASILSSGLGGYPTFYANRQAIKTLYNNLFFYPACELRPMPNRNGVSMQVHTYVEPAANTTPVTEGDAGFTGITVTRSPRTITLANYADYATTSRKVELTDMVDALADISGLLGQRGAKAVDAVISTAVDTEATADATTRIDLANNTYCSAAVANQASWRLRAVNVQPKANGKFFGIISSQLAYDLVNDAAAGGTLDLQKYADSTAIKQQALVGVQGARIGVVGGIEWYESNNLSTVADFQAAGKTGYRGYVFGFEAWIASSLGNTKLNQENFGVTTQRYQMGDNGFDPCGMIAGSAAYNFFFGVAKTPGSQNKFQRITAQSRLA